MTYIWGNTTSFMNRLNNDELLKKSLEMRVNICKLSNKLGSIHLGGLLSSVNILVVVLYNYIEFGDNYGNKFVPSKPHSAILIYLILCDLGLYEFDFFKNYKKLGSSVYQFPCKDNPYIDVSLGSLGYGLSISLGMAIARKNDKIFSRIFCLVGDGELQEGSNWEAIMYAGSHNMDNLVCIVDNNHCTASFKYGENITFNISKAFEAFGWEYVVVNGENINEIDNTIRNLPKVNFLGKPYAIIVNSKKGQGIKFLESPDWHYGSLSDNKIKDILSEIC